MQLTHGRSPGNEDGERHLVVSWEEVHLWYQMDSQPTQMKLDDVLPLYGWLGLMPRHLIRTFIRHRGVIVPSRFVASAGPDRVPIGGAFVIFLCHLFYFDAMSSDIISAINSKEVLEALIVERDEVLVLLNLGWRPQDFVVQRIVVEG